MCLILSISCSQKKSEWQGTIKEIDGVSVIKNPIEPMYAEDVFSLEEEIRIGEPQGSEEYVFSDLTGIAVTEDERIYALDTREVHIKVYDRLGNFVTLIGKKGQGPGELQYPTSIRISNQREIMVNDSGSLQLLFFTPDGEFIKGISSAKLRNFIDPKMDSQGNVVASYSNLGESFTSELKKFNSELEPILSIHSQELFKMPVMNPFFPEFICEVTKNDEIIWGVSSEYELQVLNSDGSLIKRITKEYIPIEITEDDKKEKLKFLFGDGPVPQGIKLEWPRCLWAFSSLNIDEHGHIFLKTSERTEDVHSYFYDVFDGGGRYIVKIALPGQPKVLIGGKLYTIEVDEDGFQLVKRYKVNWNIDLSE